MAPESYQVSMTSGTRRASSPHSAQRTVISSIEEPVLHGRGTDVPGATGHVDERGAAPPAQRVGVLDRLGPNEEPATPEVLDDQGVRVLEECPADECRSVIGEPPLAIERLERRPSLAAPDLEVLRTERRGQVDHARSLLE